MNADLERDYSPSSCIGGNYLPLVRAYRERSEQARAQTVAANARWQRLNVDASAQMPAVELMRPACDAACPLLIFIHGGYWQELSAADSLFAARDCLDAQVALAAVDYQLAPGVTLEVIVDECVRSVRALLERAQALQLDRSRVVISGSSAGAHLAAEVASRLSEAKLSLVLVSGVYDLMPLVHTSINDALSLDAVRARALSPLHRVDAIAAVSSAAVIAWGEIETLAFKDQSRQMGAALIDKGVSVSSFEIGARNHFDVILDLMTPGTALGDATLQLLHI